MNLYRALLLLICFQHTIPSSFGQHNARSPRSILNFNTNWAFFRGDVQEAEGIQFDDRSWFAVTVPHSMRLEKKHNGGNHIYRGVGWYRRYFKMDPSYQGKRLTLHFDGVQMNCDVYLNGQKLTSHYGGYLGFVVDISDRVRFDGNNVLALRVTNTDDPLTPPGKEQSRLDFYYYGGIYRDVKLVVTNKTYISDPLEVNKIAGGGLFISFPQVSKQEAKVNIKTHVVNSIGAGQSVSLVTTIRDKNGLEVAQVQSNAIVDDEKEFVQDLTVVKPYLWHPEHPYRYRVISKVYKGKVLVDSLTTPIGIRTIAFKSANGEADGFYINGEKLYLRGANRHQSYQYIGDAASNSMQYRDALQIKKGGFNAVRAAHYPHAPAFLDACDALGLLVIECEPGWQFFNKDTVFIQRTHQQVREMIRRDRNRPSVFLWETSLNESPTPDAWAKEIVRIAHEEMPNNQLFTADDFFARGKKYYDVSYKVINENGTDPMPAMPSLTREWGDTWIADPQKENGLRASRIYTARGLLAQCLLRQNALNGTMLEEEGGYWDHAKLDANKRIGGYFLWSFNDYTRGSDSITAFSGVVDIDRYAKFGYYQMQSMQDARNAVRGPMVFIASYNNRPDLDSTITVFSNCDQVKLYRNHKLVGTMSRVENAITAPFVAAKGGSPYYSFRTGQYEAGELRAEGVMDGRVVATHKVNTPGKAHHLKIEIAGQNVQAIADGSDMVPFYVKVCDKNGNLVANSQPLQSYTINLSIKGNGALIGSNIRRVNATSQQTEGGIGYGIIRTNTKQGSVGIVATSDGLQPAKVTIRTVPDKGNNVTDGVHAKWKEEKDGNSLQPDSDHLTQNLPTVIWQGSNMISGKDTLPAIVRIDLGKLRHLKGSRIVWGKDSDWYTYSLDVSSNGTDWQPVFINKKVSGQDYQPLFYDNEDIRYMRFTITEVLGGKNKSVIRELYIYGQP